MKRYINQRGQALITLLFFVIIGVTITSAAAIMIYVNSISGTNFQRGIIAYHIAQGGAENAKLRLLRDPSYTGAGEMITIGEGTAEVERSGTGPYVFTSTGRVGDFVRKVQFTAEYNNNLLEIIEEKEVF